MKKQPPDDVRWPPTGQASTRRLLMLLALVMMGDAVILTGGPNSYARYPKWMHSFDNTINLELKTKQSNGLIFYQDDGNVNGNFHCLSIVDGILTLDFRLGDDANDFGARRQVYSIRVEEVRVDDDRWHAVTIHFHWENVKLTMDSAYGFSIMNQRSTGFGDLGKSSDVFVGGVPKDLHILPVMSSPLRRYTKNLAGNVRNLVYRQYPQGMSSPSLIEGQGIRQNDDDYCRPAAVSSRETFHCLHEGKCYSSNEGARCDCTETAYEGKVCESEKPDGELSLKGQEWVGYDTEKYAGGVIRTKRENVTLQFKTVHGSAMLFFAGDEQNFLHLGIEDGAMIATSKFAGSEARMVRLFNILPTSRYDDDTWHTVVLERNLRMHTDRISAVHMTLTVDGRRDEISQYAPETDWISHSFAYIGGTPKDRSYAAPVSRTPFRGCLKTVIYRSAAITLSFVQLSDRGFGLSLMRTGGELSFSCSSPSSPPDVLSFVKADVHSHIELPKWNAMNSGTLSFHLRPLESDGLVLFHGTTQGGDDYVAFELIDGHLFLVLNLGSGAVRLQTTAHRLTEDHAWHSVQLERQGRNGHVIVDNIKTDFSTPGVSANLIVDEAVYLGGIPANANLQFPSSVWSIGLRKGFVGCIKNVRFNGITKKISAAFEAQNTTGITVGCSLPSSPVDHCSSSPCQNFGHCENAFGTFKCDCAHTNMDGLTCAQDPIPIDVDGQSPILLTLPRAYSSEAESVELRFKTDTATGTLLDTRCLSNSTSRLRIALVNAQLQLELNFGNGKHTFKWGSKLNDKQLHTIRVKRRGEKLLLYLDGKWESVYFLPSKTLVLEMDEISAGHSLSTGEKSTPIDESFQGQLYTAVVNDYDLLEKPKKEGVMTHSHSPKAPKALKHQSLSFSNASGYARLPSTISDSLPGPFRISLKFQTLVRHALLLATVAHETRHDGLSIEIINGRIKYTYRSPTLEQSVLTPTLPHDKHLSDMRWHALLIYQDPKSFEHIIMVDNTTTHLAVKERKRAMIAGDIWIGGLSPTSKPPKLASIPSYRGCISSIRLHDEAIDVWDEAVEKSEVGRGCSGPIARCSPTACSNGGRCIQQWSSILCDCSLTGHSGSRCQQAGTTYDFPSSPSAIIMEYADGARPSTKKDLVVLSFKTRSSSGVLLAVQCTGATDFLTLYIDGGMVNTKWNLGSGENHMTLHHRKVDDNKWHTVKMLRSDENVTIALDQLPGIRYTPADSAGLITLDMQSRVVLGAAPDARHVISGKRRKRSVNPPLFDTYSGSIAGVNYNGNMVLDMLANGDPSIRVIGEVKQSYLAAPSEKKEAIMNEYMESSHALIESIGAACLSLDTHDSCIIESDNTGFFTPVLTSVHTRRPQSPSTTSSSSTTFSTTTTTTGKPRTTAPSTTTTTEPPTTTTTTTTEATTTTKSTTMRTTTTTLVVYLEQFPGEEGSADLPEGVVAGGTVGQATEAAPALQLAATPATTTAGTVLPRPYASMEEAARTNPEYVEAELSVWNEAEVVQKEGRRPPSTTTTSTTTMTKRPTTTTRRPQTTSTMKVWPSSAAVPYPTHGIPPVRPTTPMGDYITTTPSSMKEGGDDFPRTALISIASLSVILIIAIVVFCVFRCRQNPPPGDHYPMVCNGKSASGYTPIAAELSPPLGLTSHHHDPATQPLIGSAPRVPAMKVNGYQPLKGTNGLPSANGNGYQANGNGNGIMKNGGGPGKKKDFKEWYV
ncbi:hypothetical protein PENTCL1PPCAC_1850 [Pristionchus entomophagus]|uniref:Uncharacterized protein n=1 Tax=Pristionchus entomophagus TaxID=358040 RepID=A0AAV5SBF8_9BILA|nr:hypothetical protein PENTCL1PPCAC_1850 [Pristionchus entomophagus]